MTTSKGWLADWEEEREARIAAPAPAAPAVPLEWYEVPPAACDECGAPLDGYEACEACEVCGALT